MAYRFTDTFYFLKYRLSVSVKVRTYKISVIGFGQISALNIGYISVISPRYIGKTPIYRQFIEYRLSVSVKLSTNKISVIGFGQTLVIDYQLNLTDMPSLMILEFNPV